jgi:hypothetical protein
MWRLEDGAWKISHHHSSVRPEGGSKPAAGQASLSIYSAGSQPKTPAGIDVARANFRLWNDSLQTKDPAAVARLYSPRDLSFLPTVSPMHISKMEDTNQYFTAFVKKDPFGKTSRVSRITAVNLEPPWQISRSAEKLVIEVVSPASNCLCK